MGDSQPHPTGPRLRAVLKQIPSYRAGRPAPPGAYKLSSNENPYPPLPSVVDALERAAREVNRYPDPASAALVEALAARWRVPPDHVALGTGSVAVAQQAVSATAEPGDEVVFAWRSFEAYPIIVQLAGATPVRVPLTDDATHDLDAMADAVSERTRLVFVCNPNNPTGTTVGRHALEAFLNRVPPDVLVVLDEAYHEFVRDPDVPDGLSLYRDRPNVAVLRTFSKAYGLAALRVGFAIAHTPVAAALRKAAVPFGVSSLAQAGALASLAAEDELLARVAGLVKERERVCSALRDLGLAVPRTEANFVWLGVGERAEPLAAACEQAGVVVRAFPGEGVRVTIAEPDASDRFLQVAAALAASER